MASMPAQPAPVTVGVDSHADSHVAAVVDQTGRVLGRASFAASTRGSVALGNWAARWGRWPTSASKAAGTREPSWPGGPITCGVCGQDFNPRTPASSRKLDSHPGCRRRLRPAW